MTAKVWKHDELARDLADHLASAKAAGRMIWLNMQLGPSGSQRPDVYTLNPSYSRANPLAYEVKVSVADFRRDVTAGKWQGYLQFACGVTFAAPEGLLQRGHIPEGCGLMVRSANGWRTLRAPTRRLFDLPSDVMMKIMIDGWKYQLGATDPKPRKSIRHEWDISEKERKLWGKEVADVLRDTLAARARVKTYNDMTESLNAEYQKRKAEMEARLQSERKTMEQEISGYWGELARACGVPGEANRYNIARGVRRVLRAMEKDAEVEALRARLEQVRRSLEDEIKGYDAIRLITRKRKPTRQPEAVAA